MPTLTITRNYADNTTLTEAQLDSICDSLETFLNTTGLSTDNLQDNSVGTTEIQASAVTAPKIATDAVITAKILNGNVTAEKMADAISAIKTATYTISATDSVVRVSGASGAFTATLPTAVGITGRRYTIIKTDAVFATASAITIEADGAETINGVANTTLNTQFESVELVSDGANWIIMNRRIPSVAVAFTPTGSWNTNVTYTGFWTRLGDHAKIQIKALATGVPATGSLTLNIPSGLLIDTAKLTTSSTSTNLGEIAINDNGTQLYEGFATYSTTSAIACQVKQTSGTYVESAGSISPTGPQIWANGDFADVSILVPIAGWNG